MLLKLRDGSSVTKGDKPPLPLRKSSRVAPHVLKAGATGQRRAGAGSGLRAWALPTCSDSRGESGVTKGPQSRAGTAQVGAPRAHLTCYGCIPGPREKGVDVRGGPSREEITVTSHPSPPSRALPAASCPL